MKPTQPGFPQFERRGFFMLAHSVFSDPVLQTLSGDAFRLFLWMSAQAWKFRDSSGLVRSSISYASRGTGLSEACVSRSLKALVEADLIALKERNFKLGNLWSVSVRASTRKLPASQLPQNEGTQIEQPAPSASVRTSLGLTESLPQDEGQVISIKNSKKIKNAATHSHEDYKLKTEAFLNAFETEQARAEAIQRYTGDIPLLKSLGPTARAFAVSRWWEENKTLTSSAAALKTRDRSDL